MSARPRPRPRPVQKPAATATSSSPGKTDTGDGSKSLDDDERFVRNRGRTDQAWANLLKEKEKPMLAVDPDEDGDDHEVSPRLKKKRQQPKVETKGWQNGDVKRFLSQEISSGGGDDDDVEITGESSLGASAKTNRVPSATKRKRSRSRSLTPPPEVNPYHLASAANIVRQALGISRSRSASPDLVIPSDDEDEDLDPELRQIALKVKASKSPTAGTVEDDSTVKIKVQLIPHPLNKGAQPQAWAFLMKRSDRFRELFEETAKMASIQSESLVITYRGARVYPAVSPKFLKITAPEAQLDAYEQKTFDYIAQVRARSVSVLGSDHEDEEMPGQPPLTHSDAESDAEGEKFKLIIRSSMTKNNILLVVKPTTTCEAIVAAFIKKAGISGNASKARLSVDGDKLDPESAISEADVEDGDMVEIVGL